MNPESLSRGRIHPRRRRRNRLLLAGLLPSFVTLAVALALLLTLHRNDTGLASYRDGEFAGARADFSANRWFAAVEPWVAPFNEGDAHYFLGEYESAVEDFRAALLVVPVEYECRVRLNIALARERIGDAAPDPTSARAEKAWRDARDALAAGDCTVRAEVVDDPDADPATDPSADRDDVDADPDADASDASDAPGQDGAADDPTLDPLDSLDPFDSLSSRDPFDDEFDRTDGDVTPAELRALRERAQATDQRLTEKLAAALARREQQELGDLTDEERRERERLARERQRAQEADAKDPPPPSGSGNGNGNEDYRW